MLLLLSLPIVALAALYGGLWLYGAYLDATLPATIAKQERAEAPGRRARHGARLAAERARALGIARLPFRLVGRSQ